MSLLYLMANSLEVVGAVLADGIFLHFIVCTMSTTYSISVWLIQPHNTEQYLKFLRFLSMTKLNFCCFCCFCYRRGIIRDQLHFWSVQPQWKDRVLINGRLAVPDQFHRSDCNRGNMEMVEIVTESQPLSDEIQLDHIQSPDTRTTAITGITGYGPFSMDDPPSKAARYPRKPRSMTLAAVQPLYQQISDDVIFENLEMDSTLETDLRPSLLNELSENVPFVPINEFCYEKTIESEHELCDDFDFGVYFEYWRRDRKNWVCVWGMSVKVQDVLVTCRVCLLSHIVGEILTFH